MRLLKVLFSIILVIVIIGGAGIGVMIYSMGNPTPLISEGDGTEVVCVGDSITYGQGVVTSRKTDTYTAILSELTGYTVKNYGIPNHTLLSTGNYPYTGTELYTNSLAEEADIYVIMLGSNDSKPEFWNKEQFILEYTEFIRGYLDLDSAPTVYVMIPPRVYVEQDGGNCDDTTIGGELTEAINQISAELGIEVIDIYTLTTDHPEWFGDGLHPNAEGNRAIAEEIAKKIGK
jgi:lysophospholipase L1-like esterase